VHPHVLESITEQRLEELRNSRASSIESPGPGIRRSHNTNGPVGKAKSKVGIWMVTTGQKLVNDGTGTPARLRSLSTNTPAITL
jgi:hypothetical protein